MEQFVKHPHEKLTEYLADTPKEHSCRIDSPELFRKLCRERFLHEMGVKSAGVIADILQKYSVSLKGLGRREAVEAMRQVPPHTGIRLAGETGEPVEESEERT